MFVVGFDYKTGMEKALSTIILSKSLPGNMNFHCMGLYQKPAWIPMRNLSLRLWVYSWFHIWIT